MTFSKASPNGCDLTRTVSGRVTGDAVAKDRHLTVMGKHVAALSHCRTNDGTAAR